MGLKEGLAERAQKVLAPVFNSRPYLQFERWARSDGLIDDVFHYRLTLEQARNRANQITEEGRYHSLKGSFRQYFEIQYPKRVADQMRTDIYRSYDERGLHLSIPSDEKIDEHICQRMEAMGFVVTQSTLG